MKNRDKYRIVTPNGIDEKIFVPINGQLQYVFIRGKDIKNPIILNLHGGPANPDAFLTYEFAKEITDEFTFVSWDQRGCGRTYFKNKEKDPENKTVTFEQAIEDVNALADYLCKRFHKEKIIIMGHSYGSILGVNYVHRYPEKVEKYIGIGQSISIMDTETENYNEIIRSIKQRDENSENLTKAYNMLKKKLNMENLMRFRKMTRSYFLAGASEVVQKNQFKVIFSSPDLSLTDIRWLLLMLNMNSHYNRNKNLLDFTLSANIYDAGTHFSVPMCFVSGEYDKHCNTRLLREYYEKITAPAKKLVIIERNGHSPQIHEPVKFAEEIKGLLHSTI